MQGGWRDVAGGCAGQAVCRAAWVVSSPGRRRQGWRRPVNERGSVHSSWVGQCEWAAGKIMTALLRALLRPPANLGAVKTAGRVGETMKPRLSALMSALSGSFCYLGDGEGGGGRGLQTQSGGAGARSTNKRREVGSGRQQLDSSASKVHSQTLPVTLEAGRAGAGCSRGKQ